MNAEFSPRVIARSPLTTSLENHRDAWDFVAQSYAGGSALPAWGPRGELKEQRVLASVRGKRVLEIGCGSGDSIIYLLKQGAAHVVGLDFSPTQLELAHTRLAKAFEGNTEMLKKVTFRLQSMDESLPSGPFDAIIAIYSLGWSEHPRELMKRIYERLKPGGEFCFSWDHYLGRIVEPREDGLIVNRSYHEPMPLIRENWKGSGYLIETHQLRPSDWLQMLLDAGFRITGFWEPKPNDKTPLKSIYSSTYSSNVSDLVPTCIVFRAEKS